MPKVKKRAILPALRSKKEGQLQQDRLSIGLNAAHRRYDAHQSQLTHRVNRGCEDMEPQSSR